MSSGGANQEERRQHEEGQRGMASRPANTDSEMNSTGCAREEIHQRLHILRDVIPGPCHGPVRRAYLRHNQGFRGKRKLMLERACIDCHPRPSDSEGKGTQHPTQLHCSQTWVPFPHFARERAKLAGDDR